ncbi:MAG TPA: extensin family protein, partial [Gaiellaceae bacterium]|nr:extensin family protein [Gaiellaceae bacterium]
MGGRLARAGLGGLIGLAVACAAPMSHAGFGVPFATQPAAVDEPAERYGQLERTACETELERRGIPFSRVDEARGVLAPVRLAGPLHGVTYRTALPATERTSSPWEIVDCRLALALDDFAAQLADHDVVEVIHYSAYRPPSRRWPAGKIASRHPGALAIDAATFVKKDGQTLAVERDFHGRIGAPTCGSAGAAPRPATAEAMELRQIVCDAADAKLFNVELTPDYNRAHYNHFHLEVTA